MVKIMLGGTPTVRLSGLCDTEACTSSVATSRLVLNSALLSAFSGNAGAIRFIFYSPLLVKAK